VNTVTLLDTPSCEFVQPWTKKNSRRVRLRKKVLYLSELACHSCRGPCFRDEVQSYTLLSRPMVACRASLKLCGGASLAMVIRKYLSWRGQGQLPAQLSTGQGHYRRSQGTGRRRLRQPVRSWTHSQRTRQRHILPHSGCLSTYTTHNRSVSLDHTSTAPILIVISNLALLLL
jgi:hypothetical protein